MKCRHLLAAGSLLLALAPAAHAHAQQAAASASEPQTLLYDHRQLQVAIARLATEHPELISIVPVGTSRGGRKIDALRIAAGERGPGRPAILIVANIDGPWVWTSGLALDHVERLAEGYASDARIKALLDDTTLYVIARADPDPAEARFGKPLIEARASGHGLDNDRDGRAGEDGPSDVDGDGLVTSMRVPDPDGEWIVDPTDARALIKADRKKGEHGRFKLWPEGRDSDKDEQVGEDPELDALVNRNFPQGWRQHDAESGVFATDEPEARALCEFMLAHTDIALVLTYGAQDNLVEKPKVVKDDAPRVKLVPPEGTLESDAELLAELGKRYKKLNESKVKGDNDDHGSFQAWCQAQRGTWCLNLALWSIPIEDAGAKKDSAKSDGAKGEGAKSDPAKADAPKADAPSAHEEHDGEKPGGKAAHSDDDKPSPGDDAKRLKWIDAQGESARFVAWRPFKHPELGDVEIGGFAPFALIEPPLSERERLARVQFEFLLTLGELLPRVRIVECTAKDLSSGLWEIKAVLENTSFLPLQSAHARRSGAVRPARISLRLPADAQLLAGERETLVSELAGSGGRKEFRWLVHGAPPTAIGVEAETDHAGTARVRPEVK